MKIDQHIKIVRHGKEYTLHVEISPHGVADQLLARAIRNKSHTARASYGAVKVKIIAEVPIK